MGIDWSTHECTPIDCDPPLACECAYMSPEEMCALYGNRMRWNGKTHAAGPKRQRAKHWRKAA